MRASDKWYWNYNQSNERLQLVLDDEVTHDVPYRASKLVAMVSDSLAFDMDDADVFQQCVDYLEALPAFSVTTILQVAFNATAWHRFGRPQMPQSWHFQQAEQAILPTDKRLCELNSGFSSGLFYVIEADEQFAVCMLLDSDMSVSDIKTLKQFDTVKVLLNRLQPTSIDPVIVNNDRHQHSA